jgi:hypothetical protein
MLDDELVEAYVKGRISRRAFVRRLVAGGVTFGAALTYADVLGAPVAAAGQDKHRPDRDDDHKHDHDHKHHRPRHHHTC